MILNQQYVGTTKSPTMWYLIMQWRRVLVWSWQCSVIGCQRVFLPSTLKRIMHIPRRDQRQIDAYIIFWWWRRRSNQGEEMNSSTWIQIPSLRITATSSQWTWWTIVHSSDTQSIAALVTKKGVEHRDEWFQGFLPWCVLKVWLYWPP